MAGEPGGEVLAIVGPTASGKSGLARALARRRTAIEIVAVDAFTLYRGMDVGTAKPSRADRALTPHHLIDALDPWEEVSVAWFQAAARTVIDEITARGATPLLVGGSGLYFRAVVDGLRFPPTDHQVRARLEQAYRDQPEAAYRRLASVDPAAARKIDPANLRRSVRALEVIELTGQLFSSFSEAWDDYTSIYPGLRVAYLEPPATELRSAIHARAQQMVDDGLVAEARQLRHLEQPLSSTALQAIGYREAFAVLDGERPPDGLADAVAVRTWRYAKRQRSWFRRDPRCVATSTQAVLTAWT